MIMKRGLLHRAVVAVTIYHAWCCACICAAPAGPSTRASEKLLDEAVRKLTSEIEKSKDPAKLRDQANFFTPTNAALITVEALLDTLEDPISSNPRTRSYVKW